MLITLSNNIVTITYKGDADIISRKAQLKDVYPCFEIMTKADALKEINNLVKYGYKVI